MRPRKAAAAAAAVVVDDLPPPDDLPLPEETVDAIPPDDTGADEVPSAAQEALATERICIECGSSGGGYDGCAHQERARFHAPPRGARELVARLRRAAAEHRAAARALRALVMAEHARGRADIETAAAEAGEAPQREPPQPVACPRCAGRGDGEPAAQGQTAHEEPARSHEAAREHGEPGEAGAQARRPKRKGRVPVEQQALPFTRS